MFNVCIRSLAFDAIRLELFFFFNKNDIVKVIKLEKLVIDVIGLDWL